MSTFQPPPTYDPPIRIDERTKIASFSPIWLNWFLNLVKNLSPSGAASVSSFSFTNANGITGAVANPTTTPALTLALTNITPTSVTIGDTTLLHTSVALTNGAAALVGTLNNSPKAGNPTKWIAVDDNGTTRYIPSW